MLNDLLPKVLGMDQGKSNATVKHNVLSSFRNVSLWFQIAPSKLTAHFCTLFRLINTTLKNIMKSINHNPCYFSYSIA